MSRRSVPLSLDDKAKIASLIHVRLQILTSIIGLVFVILAFIFAWKLYGFEDAVIRLVYSDNVDLTKLPSIIPLETSVSDVFMMFETQKLHLVVVKENGVEKESFELSNEKFNYNWQLQIGENKLEVIGYKNDKPSVRQEYSVTRVPDSTESPHNTNDLFNNNSPTVRPATGEIPPSNTNIPVSPPVENNNDASDIEYEEGDDNEKPTTEPPLQIPQKSETLPSDQPLEPPIDVDTPTVDQTFEPSVDTHTPAAEQIFEPPVDIELPPTDQLFEPPTDTDTPIADQSNW